MKDYSIKKLVVITSLGLGGLLSMPAHAWPEVDHMNMCGAATKVVRSYAGNSRSWEARDNYIAQRGDFYYLRTNCPKIKAPVKAPLKKVLKKKQISKVKTKAVKKNKEVKRISSASYDEKADCLRVDRLNHLGLAVQRKP